ncbi:hypothetical protein [Poseidonibacter sp.]|uniref:hypothetical protein n=2 Tax=Poseidonibacter sp. TaxID=2321188 RepID=UPI003C7311B6
MILRLSLLITLFSLNAFALKVLVSKESINYEEKLKTSDVKMINIQSLVKACNPLTLKQLSNNEYVTTHYINKDSVICLKDVKIYKKESVIFRFGLLEIEKKGKVIFENDKFIRIKKDDGTIEKIYKDGRLK